jgi:hypothetical protein
MALDAKIIYAQTNVVLVALTTGNVDYTNLQLHGIGMTSKTAKE